MNYFHSLLFSNIHSRLNVPFVKLCLYFKREKFCTQPILTKIEWVSLSLNMYLVVWEVSV